MALFLTLLAPSAQAADKDGRERAARKACLSGDYSKGVEILSDLFLDTKNPTPIFNQARCYEQNNRCSEAVGRFREYLRKAPNMAGLMMGPARWIGRTIRVSRSMHPGFA